MATEQNQSLSMGWHWETVDVVGVLCNCTTTDGRAVTYEAAITTLC